MPVLLNLGELRIGAGIYKNGHGKGSAFQDESVPRKRNGEFLWLWHSCGQSSEEWECSRVLQTKKAPRGMPLCGARGWPSDALEAAHGDDLSVLPECRSVRQGADEVGALAFEGCSNDEGDDVHRPLDLRRQSTDFAEGGLHDRESVHCSDHLRGSGTAHCHPRGGVRTENLFSLGGRDRDRVGRGVNHGQLVHV